ncbi:MAG: hypothetical protein MHPSP_002001, partial [Paramarteilia canceri]
MKFTHEICIQSLKHLICQHINNEMKSIDEKESISRKIDDFRHAIAFMTGYSGEKQILSPMLEFKIEFGEDSLLKKVDFGMIVSQIYVSKSSLQKLHNTLNYVANILNLYG